MSQKKKFPEISRIFKCTSIVVSRSGQAFRMQAVSKEVNACIVNPFAFIRSTTIIICNSPIQIGLHVPLTLVGDRNTVTRLD